ncbi:MAG: signal peptidase II [Acutalibacteraceae bacterium]
MISYALALLCGVLLLCADQLTKYYISVNFALGESHEFLKGFIDLTYIHNRGGAWGMLYGSTYILLPVTLAIMVFCIVFYVKYGKKNHLLLWAISLVMSGGIGNMIDRVFRDGNVVDFLHFEFFPSFPVFNVADCAIVVGAGLLILYFILDAIREERQKRAEKLSEQNDGKT